MSGEGGSGRDESQTRVERCRKLRRYESVIETVGDGIYQLDLSGRFVDVNDVLLDVTGYSRAELVGEHVSVLLDDDDAARFASDILELLREPTESVRTREIPIRMRDGREIPVEIRFGLLTDEGEVTGTVGIARDITERREREGQLERERDLLENVLETCPVIVGVFDAESRDLVRANDAAAQVLDAHTNGSEVLEYTAGSIPVYDEEGEPVPREERPYAWALERGEPVYDWQAQMELPGGERRWYSINAMPLLDDGEVEQVVVVGDDITQLKRQTEWLRRERDELRSELDGLFTRVTDAFIGLDTDWQFTYVNETAEAVLERSADELVGANVWEELPETVGTAFETEYRRAMETQQSVSFDEYYPPLDTWFEVRAYPSETGLSVYFQNVTERKAREFELERYETIVETVDDGIYAVDSDARFVLVNDAFCETTGYDREKLLGAHATMVHDDAVTPQVGRMAEEVSEGSREEVIIELDLSTRDGEKVPVESRVAPLSMAESDGRCGVVRDITERIERERELESRVRQQQVVTDLGQRALAERDLDTLVETVVAAVADTLEMEYCELLELHPEGDELILCEGVGWHEGIVGTATVDAKENSQAGYTLCSNEPVVVEDLAAETRFSGRGLLLDHDVTSGMSVVVGPPDDPWGILGAHATERREFSQNDVNFLQSVANVLATAIERAEHERAMEESERRYRTLAEQFPNGGVALFDEELRYTLLEGAVFEEYDISSERLLGADVAELSSDVELGDDLRRYCRGALDGETTRSEFEWNGRVFQMWAVPIVGERDEPYAGMLVTQEITELRERERELEQQRERLVALNHLNRVAREVTEAVISQSTREEIERTVCEALTSTDSYLFAWVGEVDAETETVSLREEAGVDGYLDDVTLSVDPDDPRSRGPTSRAVQTQEIQVTQDIFSDPHYAHWRERATMYGYRSSAAIPIVYEGNLYGVLNVYAERALAFTEEESEVLEQLGEVVGHAITAIERKHALTSDQLTEIDLQIENVFDELDLQATATDEITLGQSVPIGGGEYLVYGTASADDLEVVREIVERVPHWIALRVLSEGFGRAKFEIRLSEPPVLSAIASLSGYVKHAKIEDDDYHMRIQLPVTADVREFVETVQEAYPAAVMRSQRQVTRTDDASNQAVSAFYEDLTERQRAVLESAYYAGFFEWPRESTGAEVAESLGVSAPTFSQHLRKAENKVFDALFAENRGV
ncbi:PAS domain S-box protein [Haloprofundus halophilus]|uniref:PAS domain S-box protein n=1 Tax=Haloprofundus halophilus TaxID=2283527 RepID=UPI000E435DD4|nr:PAS domain S-box protein [Haloprofundus halophilus]